MFKKFLRKIGLLSLSSLLLLALPFKQQSSCMNRDEDSKTPIPALSKQGGNSLLSTIQSLRSTNLKNEEEIKILFKRNQELEKIEKEKTELVFINASLQQALLEEKKEVDVLNKKTEGFKRFEEKVTKETEKLRKENEELYAYNYFLKNTELQKEKEIEVLIEERNKLYLLTAEVNETHDILQKMMKIIGLPTDDLMNCTGNLFAKKCLDRLNAEASSHFGEQSLAIQASDSHARTSTRTPPDFSVEIKVSRSSQAPITQASVLKPIPEILYFDRWQKGLLSIHEPWAARIWEQWSSQNLTKLDLQGPSYHNKEAISIGDTGAILIANLLAINPSLTSLTLSYNQIGTTGGTAIGDALKTNFSLTCLNLSSNKIGDERGRALPNLLATTPSLSYLNLQDNNIYAFEAGIIARSLLTNSSLKILDLWGNSIGNSGLQALINARSRKPKMQINF